MKTLFTVPLVALLAGCGISTAETDNGADNGGAQSELSSARPSTTSPCPRGEAYCQATGQCYNEACLSCCFFPTCGKGEAYCQATGQCYPEACLSCCMIGSSNGDPNTDPAPQPGIDPNTDPAVCDARLCGPAPGMPTYQCADGTVGGFTGRCLPREDGTCGWEIRSCPTDDRAP